MNEETYRIKPLEWVDTGSSWQEAKTPVGQLLVYPVPTSRSRFCWGIGGKINRYPCLSIDDGKAKAEAYYRERLLSALEPVPCKETT